MSQLKYPNDVAALLHKEKILPEEVVTSIKRKPSLPEKIMTLLTSVQDAVSSDYYNLLIFSTVLKNAGNESLAKNILNDYSKYNNCVQYGNNY